MCSVMSFTNSRKFFVLRHEIGFAIHFHQHADLALQMNVGSDDTFLRRAGGFFPGAGDAFRAQGRFGLLQIAARLSQRAFAIHHAGVGFLPELLNELRIDFHKS